MSEQIKKLLVNTSQDLSEAEKLQGRHNLGIDGNIPDHVLTYDEQVLSNSEKLQVKTNLGFVIPSDLATVATTGSYTDLSNKPANLVQDASYVHTDNNFTTALKNKLDGIEAGATKDKIAFVTTSDTYATVNEYITNGYEVILKYNSSGSDLFQYFRLSQYNPDGSMEFTCIRSGAEYVVSYKYSLSTNGQWTRTDTSVSNYTGIQIDGIGRNLHLNQNNYVQTNFPGGLWSANMTQDNNFRRLDGGGFAGAYCLAARYKTDGSYELGISYSGSGSSSTITFVGTENIIALDNSITVKAASYIGETVTYSVSSRFGGNESTAFDPSRHKAIYYSGFANIGPASDVKIAIWNDNGTVKIGMTSIEVGKVGATN